MPPELSSLGKEVLRRLAEMLGVGAAETSKKGTCVIRFFDFVSLAHGLLIRLLSFILDFTSVFVAVS